MIKKILFVVVVFFMSQLALAKVFELDNQNGEHCRSQIFKNDRWETSVIMLYVKDSPGTNKFRTIYEQVSIEHPSRHLFALNVFDPKADAKKNQLIWKAVQACLTDHFYGSEEHMGKINANTPALVLFDYARVSVGVKKGEISKKEDLLRVIDVKELD